MSVSIRVLAVVLAALPLARAAEREIVRKFPVQPGCTLKVDSYRGRLTIEESDAPEVAVTVFMEAGVDTEQEAEKIFGALRLEMAAENNTVTIRARNPHETRVQWVWQERNQIELYYKIVVPRACSVDLKLGSGSITVGNLTGRHVARAESANIFFKRIQGSVDVRADSGSVIVSRCSGAVTARLRQGTIRLGTIGGRAEVLNESGDLEVMQAKGGIVAEAAAGDVSVGFPEQMGADNRVSVSGGSIFAKINSAADCTVQASSVWGHVESTLPFAVESGGFGQRRVKARLNAGGPAIVLHADGGDVKIAAMDFEID